MQIWDKGMGNKGFCNIIGVMRWIFMNRCFSFTVMDVRCTNGRSAGRQLMWADTHGCSSVCLSSYLTSEHFWMYLGHVSFFVTLYDKNLFFLIFISTSLPNPIVLLVSWMVSIFLQIDEYDVLGESFEIEFSVRRFFRQRFKTELLL